MHTPQPRRPHYSMGRLLDVGVPLLASHSNHYCLWSVILVGHLSVYWKVKLELYCFGVLNKLLLFKNKCFLFFLFFMWTPGLYSVYFFYVNACTCHSTVKRLWAHSVEQALYKSLLLFIIITVRHPSLSVTSSAMMLKYFTFFRGAKMLSCRQSAVKVMISFCIANEVYCWFSFTAPYVDGGSGHISREL